MTQQTKFGLSDHDLKAITTFLQTFDGIDSAKIFGSRAKGNYRDGSDIDIAIAAPTMDHTKYLRLIAKLDDLLLPYKIDVVLMHTIDNKELADHIKRIGVNLW